MKGRIIKGVGSFYTVLCDNAEYVCRAPGRFRREKLTPLVGDFVDFIPHNKDGRDEDGVIEMIHPRQSVCLRPPVANVDQIAIIMAPLPQPDLLLVDRLMIYASMEGLRVLLCVNKRDVDTGLYTQIAEQYKNSGAETCFVSATEGIDVPLLKDKLTGHTTCFAGQSGTGKSSLLNAILPQISLPTGNISDRTSRGKHTTRHASLIEFEGTGFVVDTPGFSLLELSLMDPVTLKNHYEEFAPYEGNCRYSVCAHLKEPGCAVIEAAERGDISRNRFARYGILYEEISEKWKNKYN